MTALDYESRHHGTDPAHADMKTHTARHRRSYESFGDFDALPVEAHATVSPDTVRGLAHTAVAVAEQPAGGRHRRYESFSDTGTAELAVPSPDIEPAPASAPTGTRRYEDFGSYVGVARVPAATPEVAPVTPEAFIAAHRIETFEQAVRVRRVFSERTILKMLNGELNDSPNAVPGLSDIKMWADKIPVPRDELILARSPSRIASLHARTRAMVGRNQTVVIDPAIVDGRIKDYLSKAGQDFVAQLTSDDGSKLEADIRARDADRGHPSGMSRAMNYPQLRIPTTKGEVDIAHRFAKPIDGLYPTIGFQHGLEGTYIHWSTKKFAKDAVKNGSPTKATYDIYLSPSPEHAPEIFEQIMTALDAQGLSVSGKMLDRTVEAIMNHEDIARGRDSTSRAAGIVLKMDAQEANRVLKLVRDLHAGRSDLFRDRPVPKMALKIGDGLGVGAEPKVAGWSFTDDRVGVLADVVGEVRYALGLEDGEKVSVANAPRARALFNYIWGRLARSDGINPNNMSFNL